MPLILADNVLMFVQCISLIFIMSDSFDLNLKRRFMFRHACIFIRPWEKLLWVFFNINVFCLQQSLSLVNFCNLYYSLLNIIYFGRKLMDGGLLSVISLNDVLVIQLFLCLSSPISKIVLYRFKDKTNHD